MKILKVFGLIIFLISLMISLIMINGLIHGMEPVDWEKLISISAFILTICLGYLFRKTLLKILLIPFQVFKRDMNKNQRLVLAIFVPIIIFFLTITIAYYIGATHVYRAGGYRTTTYDPFDWQKTWYVWVISSIFCCIFEYKLFTDKKREIRN